MKRIQLLTVLAISLSTGALFAADTTTQPSIRDALSTLFGGQTEAETRPAQTQTTQSGSLWDALWQAVSTGTADETKTQPTYPARTAAQPAQQPGWLDMIKGALSGGNTEQQVSELSKEHTVLTQKQSEFSQKINDLARQVPGGEKLLSYFQPFLGALDKKAEDVNLKLTSLAPSAEGLQSLQTKVADLTKQRDALNAQLQQVKQGPNDVFSNMFAGALKSALGAINLNIDTIKPIIALVMQKLGLR